MPTISNLVGWQIQAVKGSEPDNQNGGAPVDVWTLMFQDVQTGDQIRIGFRRDVRDEIVRQLTGGVVLAGGDFPKL